MEKQKIVWCAAQRKRANTGRRNVHYCAVLEGVVRCLAAEQLYACPVYQLAEGRTACRACHR